GETPRRAPLGPGGDEGQLPFAADRHLTGRRSDAVRREPLALEQPGRTDRGVPGEGHLVGRTEDAIHPGLAVLDVDGLRETQLTGDLLPPRLRHLGAVEEDSQRVSPRTGLLGEDAKYVESRHRPSLLDG